MTNASPEIAATGILGRQLKISQIAVVCYDLQKTMENYSNLLGMGAVERVPARTPTASPHRDRWQTS